MVKNKKQFICQQIIPGADTAIASINASIKDKGIKKKSLARAVNITPEHLSGVLNKRRPLSIHVKKQCFSFLGLK